MQKISLLEARKIALAAQGLAGPALGAGPLGALQAVERLGYVQIDTISVVERAHHHVLWTRVKDYRPAHLHTLLAQEKKIFEYWGHAASYLPMRDYRFSLPRKKIYASGKAHWFLANPEHKLLKKKILARIRAEGPLSARDFEAPPGHRGSGWFDWKPAKRALEQLFMEGALMVSERRGFQKVYDLTERVLPAGVDRSFPSPAEYARHLIVAALRAHGLARVEEIFYLRSSLREEIRKECALMQREGLLEALSVQGLEGTYYALPGEWRELLSVDLGDGVQVLSPFDNHVIQRQRLRELFDFDYTIECYVPESKRKFGYFSLPVLKGGRFVGRIDAKAERKEKVLVVKALHGERGAGSKAAIWAEFRQGLRDFAVFNGCEEVKTGPLAC